MTGPQEEAGCLACVTCGAPAGVQPAEASAECAHCEGQGRVPFEGTPGAYYRDGEKYDPPGWDDCDKCGGTGLAAQAEPAEALPQSLVLAMARDCALTADRIDTVLDFANRIQRSLGVRV